MDILIPRRTSDKRNKHRKHGRKMRPVKHRMGQTCGSKNCFKLAASRRYDESLKAYVPNKMDTYSSG